MRKWTIMISCVHAKAKLQSKVQKAHPLEPKNLWCKFE